MNPSTHTPGSMAVCFRDRTLWQPDAFIAGLLPGRSGAANGYGIGDCLLIDVRRGVYAVADASERCTEASRTLLVRFHAALAFGSGPPPPDALDAAVSAAFAGQAYTARSTFCCAALRRHRHRPVARVYNGGDSFVDIFSAASNQRVHRSAPDMQFAGRSTVAPAGTDVVLDEGDRWRILLATDGWHDLRHPASGDSDTVETLAGAVSTGSVPHLERIPGGDDLTYIVVASGAICRPPEDAPAVIMGGTAAAEAAAARRRRSGIQAPSGWLPSHRWPEFPAAIADAGMRIISPLPIAPPMEVLQ